MGPGGKGYKVEEVSGEEQGGKQKAVPTMKWRKREGTTGWDRAVREQGG